MARKGAARGQIVNRNELANTFGVHITTIDQWVRAGCPYVQRGSKGVAWQFSTADVYDWRLEREQASQNEPSDLEELTWRRERADTLKAELALSKEQGAVAYLEDVEVAVAEAFGNVRTNMRNIPSRIAGRLVIESSDVTIKQLLLDEIDQALEALADSDLVSEPDEGS